MTTPSIFSKNQCFHRINKKRVFPSSGNASNKMRGLKNGDSTREFRGSNLNLRWDKCGIWLVGWLIHSLCVSLCLSVHSTLRILMWWFSMFDCYIHLWHWHPDDIDRFYSCHDYSAHLNMYILLIAYLIHLEIFDSLGCILSWLS